MKLPTVEMPDLSAGPRPLADLVDYRAGSVVSRQLIKKKSGNLTLFAFDAGEGLSEHTAPFDALVLTLSGALALTIGGREVRTTPQSVVLMPANVPHAVRATEASRMLLVMLREAAAAAPGPRGMTE